MSAIVNDLIRRGIAVEEPRTRFVQRTSHMCARIDVTNIADVLETADGAAAPTRRRTDQPAIRNQP